ncbi:MAG: hypothetical protein DSO03_04425 [Hadesarchaea archaeon]|nr:MAG: hypothetical protein DSO03_04425 [Hadesarchaea archaeon]
MSSNQTKSVQHLCLEKQEVQSLLPQLEQVIIFEASFTFFPHWTHFGILSPLSCFPLIKK